MLKDITLGQYYPADSIVHKLDPRVKLLATLVFIVSVFLADHVNIYVCIALVVAAVIGVSQIPLKYVLKGMKPILWIIIITAVLNMLLTSGEVVWEWGVLHVTKEGISLAIRMAVKITLLVTGAQLLTLTTTPNSLTDGLEKGLRPLNKLHVPVFEIALMMSIALRFIPVLIEETDKITKAQKARGADLETGNIFKRAKNMIPILVPLFVSALRRANDLALAMEARCYHGGAGRTRLHPLKYRGRDAIGYILIAAYLAGVIILRILL